MSDVYCNKGFGQLFSTASALIHLFLLSIIHPLHCPISVFASLFFLYFLLLLPFLFPRNLTKELQ
jgi:hypothetical protein